MTEETSLTNPQLESFSIRIAPTVANPKERASEIVREALGSEWHVVPLPADLQAVAPPHTFDIVGPAEQIRTAQAWDLSYRMKALDVIYVEPVFDFDVIGDGDSDREDVISSDLQPFGATEDETDFFWSPKLIDAHLAWALEPPAGGSRFGRGIIIGHPDSGYVEHDELGPGFLKNRGRDFVDHTDTALNKDGHHGLGTASVIMSQDNRQTHPRSVTGVAPEASLIPYRVAKKHPIVPIPVLFRSGMRRLRDGILAAIADKCHVISISLGWLPHHGVHEAVREAVARNLIVLAAAGNHTHRLVVWPAKYKEVIALAACDSKRRPWKNCARGRSVDFTAPGHNIWRADAHHYVAQSSGSSHATATTAGLAALWLAFWGRDRLLEMYNGVPLAEVFRWVLRVSADPPPAPHDWGHGIVNAHRCLRQALPSVNEVRASEELQSFGIPAIGETSLVATFDYLPEHVARERISAILGVAPRDVEQVSHGVEEELAFALATNPAARAWIAEESHGDLQPHGTVPALGELSTTVIQRIAGVRAIGSYPQLP